MAHCKQLIGAMDSALTLLVSGMLAWIMLAVLGPLYGALGQLRLGGWQAESNDFCVALTACCCFCRPAAMIAAMSEAALFKAQLGACWQQVHPDIQARFDADPLPGQPIFYDGTMTRVECSRFGAALAWVSGWFTTGALCPWRGTNVPAFITVFKEPGCDDILKLRRYEFPGGRSYVFRSRMHDTAHGDLLEFVGGFMGMRVTVQERGGALFFTDAGYFIGTKHWQIRLPALLSPGKVALTHANISRDSFTISIRITHPWFGTLYEQEGVFQRREN